MSKFDFKGTTTSSLNTIYVGATLHRYHSGTTASYPWDHCNVRYRGSFSLLQWSSISVAVVLCRLQHVAVALISFFVLQWFFCGVAVVLCVAVVLFRCCSGSYNSSNPTVRWKYFFFYFFLFVHDSINNKFYKVFSSFFFQCIFSLKSILAEILFFKKSKLINVQ